MAWLTSLLKRPADTAPALEERPAEARPDFSAGPSLAILVPDAAGISSFRIAFAPESQSAAEYIGSLKADIRRETHAFWALHDKPIVDANTHIEALVLIRAEEGSDLVYIVSFLDIESAFSFTRFEVRRGLHLGNVMIYWAAFAQLREELDGISITPSFAPPTEGYTPSRPVREQPRQEQIAASTAVAEPESHPAIQPQSPPEQIAEPERVVELPGEEDPAEIQPAVEEYLAGLDKPRRKTSPEPPSASIAPPVAPERPAVSFEPRVADEPPVSPEPPAVSFEPEPAAEVPELAAQLPATPQPIVADASAVADEDMGPMWPEPAPRVSASAAPAAQPQVAPAPQSPPAPEPEPEISSPVAEEQAAIDQAFVFQHKSIEARPMHKTTSLENAGAENGMIVESQPEPASFAVNDAEAHQMAERMRMARRDASLQELAARLTIGDPEPGIETIAGDEELEFVPLNSADPANSLTADPKIDDFDIAYEVERLLRGRKWEQRDGPFSGFQSPPGRF